MIYKASTRPLNDACYHNVVPACTHVDGATRVRRKIVGPAQSRFPIPTKVQVELVTHVIEMEVVQAGPCCPHCKEPLNLHQPDESSPGQLLATCEHCLGWYSLYELKDSASEFLMLELPTKLMVEGMFSGNGAEALE
jgi:hypothetical protein